MRIAYPFPEFSSPASHSIDTEDIYDQWRSLAPAYDVEQWLLPLPVWAKRNYEHVSHQAWETAKHVAQTLHSERPMCIYVHIPFCTSKCGFCDSYSFRLGNHVARRMDEYVERLCDELRLWSAQGTLAYRPVTTVHLGGGTPTFLDTKNLERLADCIRNSFFISDTTEWALESTVESLTPSMTDCLNDLGFRRLHLGIQSLQEKTREIIGRRRSPKEVLTCIERHKSTGWIISIDLVCGLPEQTLNGWLTDIQTLADSGIDGFSLYELLIYPQNHIWAQKNHLLDRSHLPNYFLFQAGGNMLTRLGFKKNLFNHWANEQDRNIYFTHPMRGEDLLAVGTIADGTFGTYHYRHPRYAAYLRSSGNGMPGLEGGLFENDIERQNKPLATAILSNTIPSELVPAIKSRSIHNFSILERWFAHGLIEPNSHGGYQLTNNGAWLAGNMIDELSQAS